MCYTGKCRYEGHMGDCLLGSKPIPDDAGCAIFEKALDEHENGEQSRTIFEPDGARTSWSAA